MSQCVDLPVAFCPPVDVAERLPVVLMRRNTAGECVCVCELTCVCVSVCVCVCVWVWVCGWVGGWCVCACAGEWPSIRKHSHTCTRAHMHTHTHTHTHATDMSPEAGRNTDVHTRLHTHARTHAHTRTHIHTRARRYSAESDVYMFAMLVYEVFSGAMPFGPAMSECVCGLLSWPPISG